MTVRNSAQLVMAAVIAGFLASCGGEGSVVQITETRTVGSLPKTPVPDVTSAQRFGYEQRKVAHTHGGSPQTGAAAELPFTWTVPEGWQQAPERPMRLVTFTIGPNQEAECYITVLGASGGGIEANINRWRLQMGQEPLTAEQVAALPTLEVLGQSAKWVEIHGTFTSQTGETIEDAVMLSLVCPIDEFSVFVKMTGPEGVVGPQRDNFLTFCQSLRWSEPSTR